MTRILLLVLTPALARRPDLWLTSISAARSMVGRRWWRTPPFAPVPNRRWTEFRFLTAYGTDRSRPPAQVAKDMITWLEWRKQFMANHRP